MNRLTKQALDQITARRENARRLMNALNGEFEMIEACHRRLLKEYYKDEPFNVQKTKEKKDGMD